MESQLFLTRTRHNHFWLDPRTKIYLLLIINVVIINGGASNMGIFVKPILAFVPFILLLTSRKIKVAIIYAGIYVASIITDMFLLDYLTGIISMPIALLSAFGIRWFPCAIMGYYILSTTEVSEFVAAMERMHVSYKIIIPLSVMFRFFPTVLEEYHAISDAMLMRGVGMKSFFSNPMAILEYRLVPLIMSVVKIGDELSAAALTRGFGGIVKRTNICKIGFGVLDVFFVIITTVLFVIYVIF